MAVVIHVVNVSYTVKYIIAVIVIDPLYLIVLRETVSNGVRIYFPRFTTNFLYDLFHQYIHSRFAEARVVQLNQSE